MQDTIKSPNETQMGLLFVPDLASRHGEWLWRRATWLEEWARRMPGERGVESGVERAAN